MIFPGISDILMAMILMGKLDITCCLHRYIKLFQENKMKG